MDSFNPYGQNPQPNPRPGQAAASGYVHIGGGRFVQSSASTGTPSAALGGLLGFCDADWAGCKDSRKSTPGWILKLAGAAISWYSKRQSVVAGYMRQ